MPLRLRLLTELFKSLSGTPRLRVVNLLSVESLSVGDMQQVLRCSQPYLSRHLAILRSTKVVRTKRIGKQIWYSLSRASFLNYPLANMLNDISPSFPQLEADRKQLAEIKKKEFLERSGEDSRERSEEAR
jgi:ArsR family transcriptional regulator